MIEHALIKNLAARIDRLEEGCYTISARDSRRNISFTILATKPAPPVGSDLGTVQTSPIGTNRYAVVVNEAGLEKLNCMLESKPQRKRVSLDVEVQENRLVQLEVRDRGK